MFIFIIIYFLFIIWTFFWPNNKKEIYNDKYKPTRDRLFGLGYCLTFSEQHFNYIKEENQFNNIFKL